MPCLCKYAKERNLCDFTKYVLSGFSLEALFFRRTGSRIPYILYDMRIICRPKLVVSPFGTLRYLKLCRTPPTSCCCLYYINLPFVVAKLAPINETHCTYNVFDHYTHKLFNFLPCLIFGLLVKTIVRRAKGDVDFSDKEFIHVISIKSVQQRFFQEVIYPINSYTLTDIDTCRG